MVVVVFDWYCSTNSNKNVKLLRHCKKQMKTKNNEKYRGITMKMMVIVTNNERDTEFQRMKKEWSSSSFLRANTLQKKRFSRCVISSGYKRTSKCDWMENDLYKSTSRTMWIWFDCAELFSKKENKIHHIWNCESANACAWNDFNTNELNSQVENCIGLLKAGQLKC